MAPKLHPPTKDFPLWAVIAECRRHRTRSLNRKMRSTKKTVRVGIVGTGNIAGLHARALQRVGVSCELVGVHDVNAERGAAFAREHGTVAYPGLNALLHEARPDAVHICTPAGTHSGPAAAALEAGVSVYIEKPVVETMEELLGLLQIAHDRKAIIWPGHQLLFDPNYARMMGVARGLGQVSFVDSHFAFASPLAPIHRLAPPTAAHQLIDVLPHPLYVLLETMRALGAANEDPVLASFDTDPYQLFATFRCGAIYGRLSISLTARPVASSLSVSGAEGGCAVDFVRGAVTTTLNPGTSPLEKIINPPIESVQRAWRSMAGVAGRLRRPGVYPGLAEGFTAFYRTLESGESAAAIERQLLAVIHAHETLSNGIRASVSPRVVRTVIETRPIALLTGAAGFFGREIALALRERGYSVRGLGRTAADVEGVTSWVSADLAGGVPPGALDDVDVVVHAAAATSGGMDAHQRNSVGATERLLDAMAAANVRKLVYISSISVVAPPRRPGEIQDEKTPLADPAEKLGAYTWGKKEAEVRVQQRHADGSVVARILRPGALVDWRVPEAPGLLGRRLFGPWHLGFGRPSLPLATCDVRTAASAVAWCAEHFDEAPDVVNLFDPTVASRRNLIRRFRSAGWNGRFVWVPVSLLGTAVWALTRGLAVLRRTAPSGPAVWTVLRPRRFDSTRSAELLRACEASVVVTNQGAETVADVAVSASSPA